MSNSNFNLDIFFFFFNLPINNKNGNKNSCFEIGIWRTSRNLRGTSLVSREPSGTEIKDKHPLCRTE